MIMRFKHFHDRLNILVILAPGFEFLRGKCVQFPITFT